MFNRARRAALCCAFVVACQSCCASSISAQKIGEERAVGMRLSAGQEFTMGVRDLVDCGRRLFVAKWTLTEGQGRPLAKGTGGELSDAAAPLVFPRNMNRLSGPDANSCAGCHNSPRVGGAGEFVTSVSVLAQRLDFVSFDSSDRVPLRGARNEAGSAENLATIGNARGTVGMFGAGYVEMLATQIGDDLRQIRDSIRPGGSAELLSTGIQFGSLSRDEIGFWDTTKVEGLSKRSLVTGGPADPPSLDILPFSQASGVVSLREFTNTALNHHLGLQSSERFGIDSDPDGDGVVNEVSIGEVTALSVFQATLAVPGMVIPKSPRLREAIKRGEDKFVQIGCASCHRTTLVLRDKYTTYVEPNARNPAGNLRIEDGYASHFGVLRVDLTSDELPLPRLKSVGGGVVVRVYSDFKLHDVTSGSSDPNCEPRNANAATRSEEFLSGNAMFLTARLWGVANQMPYFHHGKFTTLREAVQAHAGEAASVMKSWSELAEDDRLCIVEFLKSLQVLPEGTLWDSIDENGDRVHDFP